MTISHYAHPHTHHHTHTHSHSHITTYTHTCTHTHTHSLSHLSEEVFQCQLHTDCSPTREEGGGEVQMAFVVGENSADLHLLPRVATLGG